MKIYKYTLSPGRTVISAPISKWLSAALDPHGFVVAYDESVRKGFASKAEGE